MTLREFWRQVPEADHASFTDQVKLFAWHVHTHGQKPVFTAAEIRACFTELGLHPPADAVRLLTALTEKKPMQMVRSKGGYQLEARIRRELDAQYGERDQTIAVHRLLMDLIPRMRDEAGRVYLQEAIICLRHGAFRAAITMAWNVSFDHLCHWLMHEPARLTAFNTQVQAQFAKRPYPVVRTRADFSEYKESDVISATRIAGLINGNMAKILGEKLDKRNQAAHPSAVVLDQLIAEAFISEIIQNVVLALA